MSNDIENQGKKTGSGSHLRRIGRWILKLLDLWVGRELYLDQTLVNGFPRVTAFIASDPDSIVSVYKRFDASNIRNLLFLEARVAALEALQKELDKQDLDNQKIIISNVGLSGSDKVEPSASDKVEPSASDKAKVEPSGGDKVKIYPKPSDKVEPSGKVEVEPSASDKAEAGPSTSDKAEAGPSTSDKVDVNPRAGDKVNGDPSPSDKGDINPNRSDKVDPSLSDYVDDFALFTTPLSFEYFAVLAHLTEKKVGDTFTQTFRADREIPGVALQRWDKVRRDEKSKWRSSKFVPVDRHKYFKERWKVALAIQRALKEYRKRHLAVGQAGDLYHYYPQT
jgi:hypothetical protein